MSVERGRGREGRGAHLTPRELELGPAESLGGSLFTLEQGTDRHHHLRAGARSDTRPTLEPLSVREEIIT